MLDAEFVWSCVEKIRTNGPLVHNITNYVVMNSTANALLAIGASPVMAHDIEEVEEMTAIAGALVVNIGTLSGHWITAMDLAMRKAAHRGIPVILDPVGAGATALRTRTVHSLIKAAPPSIIRGNASEIRATCLVDAKTRGVDSTDSSEDALDSAKRLAEETNGIVSVSGATDFITDGQRVIRIENGHRLMTRVTGLGCTASALTGAFAAVSEDLLEAAAAAMAVMGIAGEIAVEKAAGPGSLQVVFLDVLYNLSRDDIAGRIRMKG